MLIILTNTQTVCILSNFYGKSTHIRKYFVAMNIYENPETAPVYVNSEVAIT